MALSCLIIWFCRVTRGKIEPAMRQPLSIKRKCQGGGNGEGVAHMGIGKDGALIPSINAVAVRMGKKGKQSRLESS